ncbi:MAG: hypothetical protein ACRES7_06095 [Gammaproteobacteria bacterium]
MVSKFGFTGTLLALAFAGGGMSALAGTTNLPTANVVNQSSRASHALPDALRPVLYRSLASDAGAVYNLDEAGCATLPKSGLKACFDSEGAHFRATHSPLMLHLVSYGRIDSLMPVHSVRPFIEGNQVSYTHGNLTAWWRVLPVGFEQGFTIAKRPSGSGELILALSASGQASQQKGTLAWGQLRYGDLVVTDTNGKVIPATLRSKGDRVLIAINDVHATYPLTVDPLVWLEQEVTASDGQAGDKMGFAVAVSGNTAIVGAPAINASPGRPGAAYVFTESNGVWTQTQKLTANDGTSGANFGDAVALHGNTAFIGADSAFINGVLEGAVYVFTESDGTWSQTQELLPSDGNNNTSFGTSVSFDDATALVGATNGELNPGTVYVFTNSNGTWTQIQELAASDGTPGVGDNFGGSVALDGTTALIGASYAYRAYVFTNSDGTWTQTAELTSSDGGTDGFGFSVALEGTTAFVGADVGKVGSNTNQGVVYVFTGSGDTWTQTQRITIADGGTYDKFGYSIALSGDTALIGSMASTPPGSFHFQGAVYVFSNSGGTWNLAQKITASDMTTKELDFGTSVALDGTIGLVGALGFATNSDQGSAYFEGESNLGMAVSAPQTVAQGQQYTSQTIATNNASAASPAVAATVTVPAAASFISATATQGSCSEATGIVTCDFGQINANAGTATANVTLKAMGSPGTTIENTASVAKATPALTASAPTTISVTCPDGYTRYDGSLNPGKFAYSPTYQAPAGEENGILTGPAGFRLYVVFQNAQGRKIYPIPGNEVHKYAPAGTYTWVVKAGASGGAYTLCVMHP